MRFKVAGNKKDIVAVVVKNQHTGLTISSGAPLFLSANGTDDGLAVVSSVNLAAAAQGMFYGTALTDINPSSYGESIVFGMYDYVRLRVTTRADSTTVWASFAAGAVGDNLLPVTGTGPIAASVSADQAFSNAGSTALSLAAQVRLGGTYASATTQASSLSSAISGGVALGGASATAAFTTVKAFFRAM